MKTTDNYTRVKEIEAGILETFEESTSTGDYLVDELQARLYEEVDRLVIYYSDCWDICKEAGATNFDIDELGRPAQTISELAYFVMLDEFNRLSELDIYKLAEETSEQVNRYDYNGVTYDNKSELIKVLKLDLLVYPDGISNDDNLIDYFIKNEYITLSK